MPLFLLLRPFCVCLMAFLFTPLPTLSFFQSTHGAGCRDGAACVPLTGLPSLSSFDLTHGAGGGSG